MRVSMPSLQESGLPGKFGPSITDPDRGGPGCVRAVCGGRWGFGYDTVGHGQDPVTSEDFRCHLYF